MARAPDPNSRRSRAKALGVSDKTLMRRERAGLPDDHPAHDAATIARAATLGLTVWQYLIHLRAEEARAAKPKPQEWFGARIWPPLEPDHPSRAAE